VVTLRRCVRRYRPKKRLATRIDPVIADWLTGVAEREGWTITEATEWALSGVRHLEHRLAERLEDLLDDERQGGESVFAVLGRRLETTFADEPPGTDAPIVPPHRKRPAA